jgi:phenylpyruvate tautomerase PptA (4-oxalocrotonate tautomerase family)
MYLKACGIHEGQQVAYAEEVDLPVGVWSLVICSGMEEESAFSQLCTPRRLFMPFARIDLLKGKTAEYRATLADVVYQGIVDVLKAPDGDRFIVVGEHSPDNLIYDPHFLGWDRSPDFILIQVTSTVGNNKDAKLAFFRYIADQLKSKLSVRPDDVMINMVFVDRSDWSFGNGEPWT